MSIKTFTRIFSDGFPPARNVQPSIVIGDGMQRCIPIRCASEARVTELTVSQISPGIFAPAMDFTVELIKSKRLFDVNTDVALGTAPTDDISLYRVIPQQTGVAGVPVELDKDTPGFNYVNMDGTPTNNERFLYLLIAPADAGNGDTKWNVSITIAMEIY